MSAHGVDGLDEMPPHHVGWVVMPSGRPKLEHFNLGHPGAPLRGSGPLRKPLKNALFYPRLLGNLAKPETLNPKKTGTHPKL